MQNQRVYWVAIAAAAWLLCGGMSVKTKSSEGRRSANAAVPSVCPDVPTDAKPIAGMKVAWAFSNATTNGLRLVFADHPRACGDVDPRLSMDNVECGSSWQFAFTLPTEAQMPGTYDLHDYEANYAESMSFASADNGCQGDKSCGGSGTGAAGGAKGPESTIEIYSISDECVTGRIHRLETGHIQPEVDFTGTFQALVCNPIAN